MLPFASFGTRCRVKSPAVILALPGLLKVSVGAVPVAGMSEDPDAMLVLVIVRCTGTPISPWGAVTLVSASRVPSMILTPRMLRSPLAKVASTVATALMANGRLDSPTASDVGMSMDILAVMGRTPIVGNVQRDRRRDEAGY